jgi:AraC-like DNA-binding protein
MEKMIKQSIEKLSAEFPLLHWDFKPHRIDGKTELVSQWLGEPDEEIMVCVFKGKAIHEQFHRQDFFFINYAYSGDYGAQSYRFNNHVTIHEDECYIGQPYSGYALYGASDKDIVIIGVLIKKEVFYRQFLQTISIDSRLMHFFLDPAIHSFSDEFIHLRHMHDPSVRQLLELMAIEYANKQPSSQDILRPMTQALVKMLAREFRNTHKATEKEDIFQAMIRFMEEHLDHVTLSMLSAHFGYHPAYISARLSAKTGRSFSQILTEQRMKRAVFLLAHTDLSVEEIAPLIGYADKSNFYRTFRKYYGKTPRESAKQILPPNEKHT